MLIGTVIAINPPTTFFLPNTKHQAKAIVPNSDICKSNILWYASFKPTAGKEKTKRIIKAKEAIILDCK
jgi:hypothetical protein